MHRTGSCRYLSLSLSLLLGSSTERSEISAEWYECRCIRREDRMSAFNHTITLLTSPLNENLGEVRSYNFKALSYLSPCRKCHNTTTHYQSCFTISKDIYFLGLK